VTREDPSTIRSTADGSPPPEIAGRTRLGDRMCSDWPLWEVFVRSKGGLAHRHVGSVHAPDAQLALAHARDTYTRRQEGVSLWVVPSTDIVASDPDQAGELFEPAESKIYRHPTFYDIPDEVKHI
jgi:ring-1,2-phenylacetyl-CoA epoxidase subunit PaaB